MNTYIFVGPTIPEIEAREWLDAVYLPPISQGDIISLLRHKPQIIGIIDGYFDRVPSVWHKEILLALSRGVHVVGAASMGALRAAELHTFGMIGVGEIFRWYRDGFIDADDEVAIHHASAEFNYKPLCEALVNIRSTFRKALELEIISQTVNDRLISIARELPYWERSYPAILMEGLEKDLPTGDLENLGIFLGENCIDQKKQDAIELLKTIARIKENKQPFNPDFELQHTCFLAQMVIEDLSLDEPLNTQLRVEQLVEHARLECDNFLDLKQRAANNALKIAIANFLGIEATQEELQKELEGFTKSRALNSDEAIEEWMRRNQLTEEEFKEFTKRLALTKKVDSIFSNPNNHEILHQLRIEGKYEGIRKTALNQERILAENGNPPSLDFEELHEFYLREKGFAAPEDIEQMYYDLGFNDIFSLIPNLQKFYLTHKKTE